LQYYQERNLRRDCVFYHVEPPARAVEKTCWIQGECEMVMPKTIAAWCTVLFFLLFGLQVIMQAQGGFWPFLVGIPALGAAVFTFIGK